MRSVMWKELTAEDLRAKAAENAIVVLPVASMEQHGPHLPVGVDTFLCEAVCKGGVVEDRETESLLREFGQQRIVEILTLPTFLGEPGDEEEIEVGFFGPFDVLGRDDPIVASVPAESGGVGDGFVRPAILVIPRIVVRPDESLRSRSIGEPHDR